MAHMNKEKKAELAPGIKAALKKYGIKGSIAVNDFSTLVVNISAGQIDFGYEYLQVNQYNIEKRFNGEAASFLTELRDAMMNGNHDNSDSMTDYFDLGWFTKINIGRFDKPYQLTE